MPAAIYLDLDGVLADFDAGLRALGIEPAAELNRSRDAMPEEMRQRKEAIYERIAATRFYEDLPLMPGAEALWQAVVDLEPIILTAAPSYYRDRPGNAFAAAAQQKFRWVRARLGDVPPERFVCTTSGRKQSFLGLVDGTPQVLVDDREANVERWRQAGGLGILHLDSEATIESLKAIRANGVAPPKGSLGRSSPTGMPPPRP